MPLVIFNSFAQALLANANLDMDGTDLFKVMLSTSGYVPNGDTHDFRDDVTNEVTGTGYTAGGGLVTPIITRDDSLNRITLTLPGFVWADSSIPLARVATYYRARGGAASADELIAANVFPADVSTSGVPFVLAASSIAFNINPGS